MQISNEIIKILDYLGEKVGITVDWTSNNVLPYIQEIAEKLVRYEICTSIIWIVISVIIITLCVVFSIKMIKKAKIDFPYDTEAWGIASILIIIALIFIPVLICQVFDIAECCVIPEKFLIEYITEIAKNK